MNKTFLYPLFLAAAVALPSKLLAQDVAGAWQAPRMPVDFAVQAGTAPIEQALSTIIPPPYRIELDKSVPSSAVIVWPAGDDWMKVLRAAVAPLDLYVQADWRHNVIRVVQAGRRERVMLGNDGQRMPAASSSELQPSRGALASTPPSPAALPPASASTTLYPPLPTLPANALPLIERTRPANATAAAKTTTSSAAGNGSRIVPTATVPGHPATPFVGTTGVKAPRKTVTNTTWSASNDDTLRATLSRWSAAAGWNVYWDAASIDPNKDFSLGASAEFHGSFPDALDALFAALPPAVDICVDLRPANLPPLVYVTACK